MLFPLCMDSGSLAHGDGITGIALGLARCHSTNYLCTLFPGLRVSTGCEPPIGGCGDTVTGASTSNRCLWAACSDGLRGTWLRVLTFEYKDDCSVGGSIFEYNDECGILSLTACSNTRMTAASGTLHLTSLPTGV